MGWSYQTISRNGRTACVRRRIAGHRDGDASGEIVSGIGGARLYRFDCVLENVGHCLPDLVAVAPRWLDQHRDMVIAAAERGVRGIYLEKPMCRTLEEPRPAILGRADL